MQAIRTTRSIRHLFFLTGLSLGAAACSGLIGEPAEQAPVSDRIPGGQDPGKAPDDPPVDPSNPTPEISPAPAPRVARLTHAQWTNTVQALLQLASPPAAALELRGDPAQSGFIFDNNADALEIDQVLWGAYQRAAAAIASEVTGDPAKLARIVPAAGGDDAQRARAFVTELGRRAHRRPLTPSQIEDYLAIHRAGSGLYEGVPPFEAGVRLVLEAFLQSPYFLYRIEESSAAAGDEIPLDDWEIASRLSYALWNTMPDQTLFDAAAAGELTDPAKLRAIARRMLDDPRAERVVSRFHHQLLDVEKFASIAPAANIHPSGSGRLAAHAARENDLFVIDTFVSGGGLERLLTGTETFVNAELAEIYEVPGTFGDEFVKVSLDPAKRRGLFTQVGFLAANATPQSPDPIHRGVFLTTRIACNPLGAPPANIPPLPPPMGRTNRETVEDHTEQPGSICAGCHSTLINPFGFPFEGYDAAGRVRTEDNGFPLNTRSDPLIGGKRDPVSDAVDLAEKLAESEVVHACYARHWIELTLGRKHHARDAGLMAHLASLSRDGASIKDLLVELVSSPAFVRRSAEELP